MVEEVFSGGEVATDGVLMYALGAGWVFFGGMMMLDGGELGVVVFR